jgi:hypothetical protein
MIESALLFAADQIIVACHPIVDSKKIALLHSALKELCRSSVSKVIQMENVRLAVSTVKIRDEMLGFACFGEGTDPRVLLDLSANMAEVYIQKFARLSYGEKQVQNAVAKEFEAMVVEANKRLSEKRRLVVEIDENLKGTTELSKNSLQKMFDRGSMLNDLDDSSRNLGKQALDFEVSTRQLKRAIQRQRMKTYLVMFIIILLTFVFFFRRVMW